jgi:hypothetical protein
MTVGVVSTSADNAAAESFNALLKREILQGKTRDAGTQGLAAPA